MEESRLRALSASFRTALLQDTLPFWIDHCVDRRYGGFATFVDRRGEPLSGDKGGWVQGRFTWLLARLYNTLEKRPEWLALSRHGIEFIERCGISPEGRVYFTLTREGKPLRLRRYIYAETFAAIAFAEYGRAAGDAARVARARALMEMVERLLSTPGALAPKFFPDAFQARSHAVAMIRVATYQILREADPANAANYSALIDRSIAEIFDLFLKPERRALLETVGPGGEMLDGPAGRCVNPGHAIETCWFLMTEARFRRDRALLERALPILDWSLERGWDPVHGGLFSFVDVEGRQPEQVEWDMKYWWPHTEAIYATLLAHALTGRASYAEWFERVLDWALAHFPDREHGEWFGYLHRDGSVAMDLKGNNWKGPFHLPRAQLYCALLLEEMIGRGVPLPL